jgi:hypothetical protein
MIGAVVTASAVLALAGQEPLDLPTAQACITDMLIVETALEEGHWRDVPGAVLPPPGSQSRILGMVLMIDAFAKAAEREGIDPATLEAEVMAKVDQAPRATTASEVAVLLKRESECFALAGAEQP